MLQLKSDDLVIQSEGLSELSLAELTSACQSRGIRTLGVSEDHLRSELAQWVDLHLTRGLSGTLLILSKAFAFNRGMGGVVGGEGTESEGDDIMRSLKDTLASLPDNLVSFLSWVFCFVAGSGRVGFEGESELTPHFPNSGQRNGIGSFV